MASTQTSTMTQNTAGGSSYAPWITDAQKGLAGLGFGLNANFLQPTQQGIAGFNPDQQKGFDMLRGTALQYGTDNASGLVGGLADRSQATAAQLAPNEIAPFINPFLDQVGRRTLDGMRREYRNADAMLAARDANTAAFGGSGGAIARGQAARGYNTAVGDTISGLMAQGYDRAMAPAMSNAQMRQQANMANASNAINAATAASNIMTADQGRQLSAIGGLLSGGQAQQDLVQRQLDLPHQALQRLAALIPGVYDVNTWQTTDRTDTTPDNSPSPFSQLLGLGSSILGGKTADGGTVAGSIFSKLLG